MFYGFGQRQRELLEKLLHRKSGLTIDELAKELGITRNAVQQHALSLEKGKMWFYSYPLQITKH
jgi:predicted ArsR family transcriptional regulator